MAIGLEKLEDAFKIANQDKSVNKYKQVGDLSLINGKMAMAVECFEKSDDFGGLLLIHSSTGNREGLERLAKLAVEKTRFNVAFSAYFLLRDLDQCLEVLISSKRLPEAAFFARSFMPSKISEVVQKWKKFLEKEHSLTGRFSQSHILITVVFEN